MAKKTKQKYTECDAWNLVRNTLKSTKMPSWVTSTEHDDGSISFLFRLGARHGHAWVHYKLDVLFLVDLLEGSYDSTTKVFENMPVQPDLIREGTDTFAGALLYGILRNVHLDLLDAFRTTPVLAASAMIEILGKVRKKHTADFHGYEASQRSIDEILSEKAKQHKERLIAQLRTEEFETPERNLLAYFYDVYLPKWQNAKKCFRRNQQFDKWPEIVGLAFDLLPSDLILRLKDADPYRSMASAIALEHAARLVGFPDDSLGTRALQKHLFESRAWGKEVGEAGIDEALGKYVRRVQTDIAERYRFLYMMGQSDEPDFSDSSLMHREFAKMLGEPIRETITKLANAPNMD